MTDYLEEHLGGAEALLELVRQVEQKESALSRNTILRKNADYIGHAVEHTRDNVVKSGLPSHADERVYNMKRKIDQLNHFVEKSGAGLIKREDERDAEVNSKAKIDGNIQDPGQIAPFPGAEETQTGAERGSRPSPLFAQLEELDRAASALATPILEGRETPRGGYPISLPGPQNLTGVPGETRTGPDAATGADFAYSGRQTWAEQADRIFRRDSRRYDGGFTLY